MHNEQSTLLIKIINKDENWDLCFEKLFIDIIPVSIKIIRKLRSKFNYNLLEEGDFLTKTFSIYEETIKNLQNNHSNISSIDDLLKIIVPKLNNEFVKIIRKIEKNKKDLINHCIYNEEVNYEVKYYNPFNDWWYINAFVDAIKNNYFYTQLVLLKISGKNTNEISKILNISKSKTYRYITKMKNIYERIKSEDSIE